MATVLMFIFHYACHLIFWAILDLKSSKNSLKRLLHLSYAEFFVFLNDPNSFSETRVDK